MLPIDHSKQAGFSLIELIVVIIILGVLAVTVAPRFIDIGTEARTAKVTELASVLKSTSDIVYAKCLVDPSCDDNLNTSFTSFDNRPYRLNRGRPDSGNSLNVDQIDTMIVYDGFTASLETPSITRFSLDNAPDPARCYVDFYDVFPSGPARINRIETEVSGC